jgi:NitT/TauT family transport system substrate-binding protein
MATRTLTLTRRTLLSAGVAGGSALLAGPTLGQAPRTVEFTLPWLAEGSSLYVYVARNRGMWTKRGLRVNIARGYGSNASAQAVAAGRFQFGLSAAPSVILQAAKGLALQSVAIAGYNSMMSISLLGNSPIRTPKDLEGRTMGATPSSAEFPFFGAFAQSAGLDASRVSIVHVDNKVRELSLIERKVDAISGMATSTIPALASQGVPIRVMLFSEYGLPMYGQCVIATPETVARDPGLTRAFTEGMLEAIAWSARNPEEAIDIFMREVTELGITSTGRDFSKLGLGLYLLSLACDETKGSGLGHADMARCDTMVDLVMKNVVGVDGTRPETAKLFTNDYVGGERFAAADWTKLDGWLTPFRQYV